MAEKYALYLGEDLVRVGVGPYGTVPFCAVERLESEVAVFDDFDRLSMEILKPFLLGEINRSVNAYIYSIYDSGTQASLQALWCKFGATSIQGLAAESVWAWTQSVMVYYYQQKVTIEAASDVPTLCAITWDFTQFDATDPQVSLGALMATA